MFGCSVVMPVEALLQVNGFDEDCDPMGGEDYCCGMMLERRGFQFRYHRKMMTVESEECHGAETPFARPIKDGNGPNDASQRMLRWVQEGQRVQGADYYGGTGLRGVREGVLRGEEFPVVGIPEHDWRDQQPLREMKGEC